ncbi:unnamed protein product [Ceratitis capitata]|uniref:Glucosylceramidase n=1 Tax=Ceratitis capitata TaxID=7213 RepID=W8CBH1_CERCA|nr:unnamed protein product [Ceratitis capitata]
MAKESNSFRFLLVASALASLVALSTQSCALREYETGLVCVCNAKYCDYLADPTPKEEYEFAVVSTSKAGLRFETLTGLFNLYKKYYIFDYDMDLGRVLPASTIGSVQIEIAREKRTQKIPDFSGSFQGAVSQILQQLPKALQEHIYKSFYSQQGIGLNLLRSATTSGVGVKSSQKTAPILGSWARGEQFAQTLLQDIEQGFNGWFDWNLVLDEEGSPNYAENYEDAPIIANLTSRLEFYRQPMFYSMGHFTKFLPKGSVRISAESTNPQVSTVAFLRPDQSVAVLVINSESAGIDLGLQDNLRGGVLFKLPPNSIHTILYK